MLRTYLPESCEHRAQSNDVIHYHYVGRLDNGTEFGKRLVVWVVMLKIHNQCTHGNTLGHNICMCYANTSKLCL